MPLVEEALGRMRIGLQEMRVSRAKAVKLIHGYGSTGRGGKIRDAVRDELAVMKRRKIISDRRTRPPAGWRSGKAVLPGTRITAG